MAKNCEWCDKPDKDKPMAFRGEEWCCEDHRKYFTGEKPSLIEESEL